MKVEPADWPSQDDLAWFAQQQGKAYSSPAACAEALQNQIHERCCSCVSEVTGRAPTSVPAERMSQYMRRFWNCIALHWKRLAEKGVLPMATVIERLEHGDLGYERAQDNVLLGVTLAQAMEFHEPLAVEKFTDDYMPLIQATASRVGGRRGQDAVDNFVVDLIMPRDDRGPRIASFRGKTSLASWLRVVVTNHCVTLLRSRPTHTLSLVSELEADCEPESGIDTAGCENLLKPLFLQVVSEVPAEDRLLMKLLLIDDLPQKDVAAIFGVHSGNITRRRQRVGESIFERLKELTKRSRDATSVDECLQLVLTGGSRPLGQRLGEVLATGLRPIQPAGDGGMS
jgi:RNA polymerase sigma factor (sigma-70 family)